MSVGSGTAVLAAGGTIEAAGGPIIEVIVDSRVCFMNNPG